MLSENQKHLIELDKKKKEIKEYYEDLQETLEKVVEEIGIEGHFQDMTDGTIFQIVEPAGKFITFNKFDYLRTKREGEDRGTLSMKKARELIENDS